MNHQARPHAREASWGEMPKRIAALPRDYRGYPIPWFVRPTGDDRPDFRVAATERFTTAVLKHRCWICGGPMGPWKCFVVGPMCVVNRVSSEPPSHRECALFAVRACPFLAEPRMRRDGRPLPEEAVEAAGMPLLRNPGVSAVYITREFQCFRPNAGNDGVLIELGKPEAVLWWCERRPATRREAAEAIRLGLPALQELAAKEGNGASGALAGMLAAALPLLPSEDAVPARAAAGGTGGEHVRD